MHKGIHIHTTNPPPISYANLSFPIFYINLMADNDNRSNLQIESLHTYLKIWFPEDII